MSKLILVTTGTSALYEHSNYHVGANGKIWEKPEDLSQFLEDEALNKKSPEYDHQKKQVVDSLKQSLMTYYRNNEQGLDTLSAELASLLAMEKDESIGSITSEDRIVLLHSDTQDGKLCAEANAEVMREKSWNVEIHDPITDLKIFKDTQPSQFINGLRNLAQEVTQIFSNSTANKKIMVASGGYKGILITVAHTSWDQGAIVIYLFEKASNGIILRKPTPNDDGLRALG